MGLELRVVPLGHDVTSVILNNFRAHGGGQSRVESLAQIVLVGNKALEYAWATTSPALFMWSR